MYPGGLKSDKIISGEYSRKMWNAINSAKTKRQLREALYLMGCRLQELESKIDKAWNTRKGEENDLVD